ncbi:hypothetical protein [Jiangella anatolica]|uniref:hypothetical protein n=1 Tax=Jiangella anatolica TaxID=2670374 RepID=UPI0013147F8D|nr:hypothetical protein [Jiangella anatolica]
MSPVVLVAVRHDDPAPSDDGDFGWGPSGVVWAGFGWLVLVVIGALLLRRRASRRR